MAAEHEGVGAAVGFPQPFLADKAGKMQVGRGLGHGLAHAAGHQRGRRIAEPEKLYLGHAAGQGNKIQNALALHVVPHADHRARPAGQAAALPESGAQGGVRREEIGIHPIGKRRHRRPDAVAAQQPGGVGGGGQHQVGLVVTVADPAAEQRGQQVGAGEGMAEILLGGMAEPDHRQPPPPRPPCCPQRAGQHGVQVDHIGGRVPAGHGLCARRAQGSLLVVGRLPHAAAAHQGQGAGIDMHTKHGITSKGPAGSGR